MILLLASVLPKVSTLKIYCERSQAPKTSLSIWFNCCPRSVRVHNNSGFVGIEKLFLMTIFTISRSISDCLNK